MQSCKLAWVHVTSLTLNQINKNNSMLQFLDELGLVNSGTCQYNFIILMISVLRYDKFWYKTMVGLGTYYSS